MESQVNNPKNITPDISEEQEIDLLELARKVWKDRLLVLKWCGIALVVAIVVAYSIPKEYTTTVGGGVVEITMTGDKVLKSLTLKPEVVDPEDIETLQDLIISGVNEVLRQVETETEDRMNEISGGLNIPGLF